MTFLATPRGYGPEEFEAYAATLKWNGWKPSFIVLHNTAEPNLAQWQHNGMGQNAGLQRIKNLNHYYASLGWHSGPHIFVAPDYIWVACDLTQDGVHASCYNHVSIGVEMVGDYARESFETGAGAQVRDNAIVVLAALHKALGISPDTLHFHKECIRDHHDCPGSNVVKTDVIARVKAAIAGSPVSTEAASAEAVSYVSPTDFWANAKEIYKGFMDKLSGGSTTPPKWAHNFACGMVAQAEAEASLDPSEVGDHGEAVGLWQLHGNRVSAIAKGCGITITPKSSVADNIEAAWWELSNPERKAFNEIKQASYESANAAGAAACTFYERAGAPGQAIKRATRAGVWDHYFSTLPIT